VQAAIMVFLPLKLASVWMIRPTVQPDGVSYRTPDTWLDFSLTSLDGSSLRPWGTTIWMALWPGDLAIQVAQAALSFVVWSVLALVVAAHVDRAGVRRGVVVLLIAIACTAQVANWDTVMQGDSVSISSGVLTLALALRLAWLPSWSRAAGFLVVALWFSMTRPNVFPILIVMAGGMAVIGLVRRQALLWATVAVGLVAISAYTLAYNLRTDHAWNDRWGFSKSTIAYAYPVGVFNPVAEEVIADLRRSDAPPCMIPATPDDVSRGGTTRWATNTSRTCPGMNEWALQNWNRWWASWLVSNPWQTLILVDNVLPSALSPSVWGNVKAPTPNSVSQLFFGSPKIPQDNHVHRSYRTQPALLWLAAAISLGLVAARRRRWRAGNWVPDVTLALTALGALGSAISSILLIQTVPHEVAQENLAASVMMTASLVIAVCLGLNRVLTTPAPVATTGTAQAPPE
jgi:hypothetical protein